jgi:hypothetical protein
MADASLTYHCFGSLTLLTVIAFDPRLLLLPPQMAALFYITSPFTLRFMMDRPVYFCLPVQTAV